MLYKKRIKIERYNIMLDLIFTGFKVFFEHFTFWNLVSMVIEIIVLTKIYIKTKKWMENKRFYYHHDFVPVRNRYKAYIRSFPERNQKFEWKDGEYEALIKKTYPNEIKTFKEKYNYDSKLKRWNFWKFVSNRQQYVTVPLLTIVFFALRYISQIV